MLFIMITYILLLNIWAVIVHENSIIMIFLPCTNIIYFSSKYLRKSINHLWAGIVRENSIKMILLLCNNNFFLFLNIWENNNKYFVSDYLRKMKYFTPVIGIPLFTVWMFRQKWNIKMDFRVITNMMFLGLEQRAFKNWLP